MAQISGLPGSLICSILLNGHHSQSMGTDTAKKRKGLRFRPSPLHLIIDHSDNFDIHYSTTTI